MSLDVFASLLGILVINLILSWGNAIVIVTATLRLPTPQRKRAIFWGTLGAIILRIVFTTVAAIPLLLPYIRSVGGLLLAWIGIKLLSEDEGGDPENAHGSMVASAKTIIIADLLMSYDNVLPVAGLSQENITLLIALLLLSSPLVIWGSYLLSNLMRRWKGLVFVGVGLIGFVAAELILKEPYLESLVSHPLVRYSTGIIVGICIVILGYLKLKKDIHELNRDVLTPKKESSLKN